MDFEPTLIRNYMERFKKKSGATNLKEITVQGYTNRLNQMNRDGFLQLAFTPEIFMKKCEESKMSPSTMNGNLTVLMKLLTCMTEEEMQKHWPKETNFSFHRINGILEMYRSRMTACQNAYHTSKRKS